MTRCEAKKGMFFGDDIQINKAARPPATTEAMAAARAVLVDAGALLAADDAAGAARLLTRRAADLLACDGAQLDALCEEPVRTVARAVLEAVAEEAAAVEATRRDLLQFFVGAARNSSGALDAAVSEEAETIVAVAFVDFLDAEVARVVGAEDPSQELLDFLRALRERVANEVEKQVFGAGAEALKRVLAIGDADLRRIAFIQAIDGPARLDVLACLEETRRDLKARDGAPADVVAALDGLAAVAAATPIDVDAA